MNDRIGIFFIEKDVWGIRICHSSTTLGKKESLRDTDISPVLMSTSPVTPRGKTAFTPVTPATSRVAAASASHPSPHYSTTRRHSLYGVEDRVVIDPGSRIWKVGFSGEGRPRDVFYAGGTAGEPLWKLRRAADPVERTEEDKLLQVRLQKCLRSVFHE